MRQAFLYLVFPHVNKWLLHVTTSVCNIACVILIVFSTKLWSGQTPYHMCISSCAYKIAMQPTTQVLKLYFGFIPTFQLLYQPPPTVWIKGATFMLPKQVIDHWTDRHTADPNEIIYPVQGNGHGGGNGIWDFPCSDINKNHPLNTHQSILILQFGTVSTLNFKRWHSLSYFRVLMIAAVFFLIIKSSQASQKVTIYRV